MRNALVSSERDAVAPEDLMPFLQRENDEEVEVSGEEAAAALLAIWGKK